MKEDGLGLDEPHSLCAKDSEHDQPETQRPQRCPAQAEAPSPD